MARNLLIFFLIYVIKYSKQRIKTELKNRQQTIFLFSFFLFKTVPIIFHSKNVHLIIKYLW